MVRALLLLQGAILIATTIEAVIWGFLFSGTLGAPALVSAAAAGIVLVARPRMRPDRRRTRRLLYLVECVTLATFVVNAALAVVLAHALPPLAAMFTDCALPLSVVLLLRRSTRAARTATAPATTALEAAG